MHPRRGKKRKREKWTDPQSQRVQDQLRAEVLSTNQQAPTADLLNNLPILTSVLYELLRLYPPVSQLINRVTTSNALLGGKISIPQRTWVGWNAYGAHVDTANWGKDAYEFLPGRWGETVEQMQTKFRQDCVGGRYIPFNAHSRKCLGQGFALLEMKVILFELVRRGRWGVHEGYRLKLTSVSVILKEWLMRTASLLLMRLRLRFREVSWLHLAARSFLTASSHRRARINRDYRGHGPLTLQPRINFIAFLRKLRKTSFHVCVRQRGQLPRIFNTAQSVVHICGYRRSSISVLAILRKI